MTTTAQSLEKKHNALEPLKLDIDKIRQSLNIETYTLDNGMKVVLYQDKSTPIVTLYQNYHVGAREEVVGKTGLAHFLEHYMFRGTQNFPPYFQYASQWGAQINAATSKDYTFYYGTFPSYKLEKALQLEADRMRNVGFLKKESLEKFNIEKQAVIEERLLRVDNQEQGLFWEDARKLIFSKLHAPYGRPVIGTMEDIKGLSPDVVKDFYDTYYHPNNSTLVLGGNFEITKAKEWIQKYYGTLLKSQNIPPRKTAEYDLKQYKKQEPLVKHNKFSKSPRLLIAYPTYNQFHEDSEALGYLSMILEAKGPLFEVLVKTGKAISVSVYPNSGQIAGSFLIIAQLPEKGSYVEVVRIVDKVLEEFKTNGVSEKQLEALKKKSYKNFIDSFLTTRGITQLLSASEYMYGNHEHIFQSEKRYQAMTVDKILNSAKKYFNKERQEILVYLPEKLQNPKATGGN